MLLFTSLSCSSLNDAISISQTKKEKSVFKAERIGEDFQINSSGYTGFQDSAIDSAIDKNGNTIFVWKDDSNNTSIIKFRRFNNNGDKDENETEVADTNTKTEATPRIIVNNDSSFVIFWVGIDDYLGFMYSLRTYSQQYTKDGIKLGDKIIYKFDYSPKSLDVKQDYHGNYLIASVEDINSQGLRVHVAKFAKTGKRISNVFDDNSFFYGYQNDAKIALNKNGSFILFWSEIGGHSDKLNKNIDSRDGSGTCVLAQKFDSNFNKIGEPFIINETTKGDQESLSIAMDDIGNITVVYFSSELQANISNSQKRLIFLKLDPDGNKISKEIQVSEYMISKISNGIVMDKSGNFIIFWNGRIDYNSLGIWGQLFNNKNEVIGDIFKVNSKDILSRLSFTMSIDEEGSSFVVAWNNSDKDNKIHSNFAQRFKINYEKN